MVDLGNKSFEKEPLKEQVPEFPEEPPTQAMNASGYLELDRLQGSSIDPAVQRQVFEDWNLDFRVPSQEQDFIRTFSDAAYSQAGTPNFNWLINQHPEDLQYAFDPEVATMLQEVGAFYSAQLEFENRLQTELDNDYTAYERRRQAAMQLTQGAWNIGEFDPDAQREATLNELFGTSEAPPEVTEIATRTADELIQSQLDKSEERYAELVREQEQLIMGQLEAGDINIHRMVYGVSSDWKSDIMGVVGETMNGVVDTGAQLLGGITWLGSKVPATGQFGLAQPVAETYIAYSEAEFQASQNARIEEAQSLQDMSDEEYIAQTFHLPARQAWEEAPDEVRDDYVLMALGDENLGFALFAQAASDVPEVRDQLKGLIEQRDGDVMDLVKAIEAEDFTLSGAVLEHIGAYGRLTSGLATGLGILVTDSDLRSEAMTGQLANLYDEVERFDATPSKMLGIDGTFAGLAVDILGPMATDPLTWLIGPSAGRALGGASSVDEVTRLATGATGRAYADDAVRIINEGRGPRALNAMFGGLDMVPSPNGGTLFDDLVDAAKAGDTAAVQETMRTGMLSGAGVGMPSYSFVAYSTKSLIERGLSSSVGQRGPVAWLRRWMTPRMQTQTLHMNHTQFNTQVRELMLTTLSDDTDSLAQFMDRFQDVISRHRTVAQGSADNVIEMASVRSQLGAIDDFFGGITNDLANFGLDGFDEPGLRRLRTELADKATDLDAAATARPDIFANSDAIEEVTQVVQDFYDHINRTQIATNRAWKEFVDPDTGLVPWSVLTDGNYQGVQRFTRNVDDWGKFAKQIGDEVGTSLQLPMSPLDLIAATRLSSSQWMKFKQMQFGQQVAEYGRGMNKLWILDKVLNLGTAATVSADEWLRIFHQGGLPAVTQYLEDHAMFMVGRVKRFRSLLGGSGQLQFRTGRWSTRLDNLANTPSSMAQTEMRMYQGAGRGYRDLTPGQPGHIEAGRVLSSRILNEPAFRAYLRGEDFFRDWFKTSDAADYLRMRNAGGTPLTADDMLLTFNTIFENQLTSNLATGVTRAQARKAWTEAATQIDDGIDAVLPGRYVEGIGTVRAPEGIAPRQFRNQPIDAAMERLFSDPIQYRQGFLAELVRTTETERLMNLFASQGKRVVSNTQVSRWLGTHGVPVDLTNPTMRAAAMRRLMTQGIIPQSYVDDLVEMQINRVVEHTLYSNRMGSLAGGGALNKMTFPFGRPWADFWGFYGREVLSRPVMRGWITEGNMLSSVPTLNRTLRAASGPLQAGGRAAAGIATLGGQFNPRPLAMASRIANTSFETEQGDFSPILFFPTKDDDGLYTLLPGVGYIPTLAMDYWASVLHDPVTNPTEHQELRENIGQFVQGFDFSTGTNPIARTFGSGAINRLAELSADFIPLADGLPFVDVEYDPSSQAIADSYRTLFADWEDLTMRNQATRVEMVNDNTFEDLLSIEDPEQFDTALMAVLRQVNSDVAMWRTGENAIRTFLPVRADFDDTREGVAEVWTDLGQTALMDLFPDGAPTFVQRFYDSPQAEQDPETIREVAGTLRDAWWDLEPSTRDELLVGNPHVAFNMISSWEWSQKARDSMPSDAATPYRYLSGPEGQDKHRQLIENGFLQPVSQYDLVMRATGMVLDAQNRTTKRLYEGAIEEFNNYIYDVAVVGTENEALLNAYFKVAQDVEEFAYESPRELWGDFRTAAPVLRTALAEAMGVEEEELPAMLGMPGKSLPWGTTFTGSAREAFTDLPIGALLSPEFIESAGRLGMDIPANMNGQDFLDAINSTVDLTSRQSPMAVEALNVFKDFIGSRAVFNSNDWTPVTTALRNPDVPDEWKTQVRDFQLLVEQNSEFYDELPEERRQMVQDRFQFITHAAIDGFINWDDIWRNQFEVDYGPLGWEPPDPPPVFEEGGAFAAGASAPYIHEVLDGDTLIVSDEQRGPLGAGPRMYRVRLIGVNAAESGSEEGVSAEKELRAALNDAIEAGENVYIVTDDRFGNSSIDIYGRKLAWLYIGDEPYFFEEHFDPRFDPGGNSGTISPEDVNPEEIG